TTRRTRATATVSCSTSPRWTRRRARTSWWTTRTPRTPSCVGSARTRQDDGMKSVLNVILNVVWLVLAGIPLALGYALAGLICFVLIITIPWGVASFRVANYVLWPFGRTVVDKPSAGLGSALGNVIWILVAGIWLVLEHIAVAVALA